ncbi:MAG: trypsin-like peptidase domain-containing protein [Deinococcota bacterium]
MKQTSKQYVQKMLLTLMLGVAAFVVVLTTSPNVSAQQTITPIDEGRAFLEDEQNTIDVIETYGASVVAISIEVQGNGQTPGDFLEQIPEQFRDFFNLPEDFDPEEFDNLPLPPSQGSGSGFVVGDNGQIITNYHVVRRALEERSITMLEGADIRVIFPGNDEEVSVRVVGANALYDIALLELENSEDLPADLLPIPISNSDGVRVGQKTIAIGNPFGFESTVTAGIVSGIGRNLPGVGEINVPLLQTDAAINPGNSGGPLLNSRGELIGINTAIIPQVSAGGQRGNLGIGFAVPSNILDANLAEMQAGVFSDIDSRPRLGVIIRDVNTYPENVRDTLNLPESGVVVMEVQAGSAAEQAGLQGAEFEVTAEGQTIPAGGDVILAVNGEAVRNASDIQDVVFSSSRGDVLELTVWRDGEEQMIPVTLDVVPVAGNE